MYLLGLYSLITIHSNNINTMKKTRFFAIMMAALMTIGLVSCKNDDEIPYDGKTLANGEFIEIESYGNDNNASYKLHFTMGLENNFLVMTGLDSPIVDPPLGMPDIECHTGIAIMDFGKVSGLVKIDEIPADNEFKDQDNKYVNSLPAVEKHGYVIKVWGAENLDSYQHPQLHDATTQYIRLWLEEQTDNGFKLRYEFPYVPED